MTRKQAAVLVLRQYGSGAEEEKAVGDQADDDEDDAGLSPEWQMEHVERIARNING